MKIKQYLIKDLSVVSAVILSTATTLSMIPAIAFANSATGTLVVNLDANALAGLNGGKNEVGKRYMYVEDIFDQSYNNVAIKGDDPNPTPGIEAIASLGLKLSVNGASISPAPAAAGRQLQSTTLNYTNDPTKGTGVVGFSGAIRYHSDVWPGTLLMQEMTLSYDPTRVNKAKAGESGWVIKTNEAFFGTQPVFDITDVSTSTINGSLKLSGKVFMTDSWAVLLSIANGIKVGDISLVPPDNAAFDANSLIVAIQDVKLQNQHYDVQLQFQGNNLFTLKTAQSLSAQQHNEPAIYDTVSQDLSVPKVWVSGKYYTAKLHNVGNYQFRLDQFADFK